MTDERGRIPTLYTVPETAELLKISKSQVYALIQSRRLEAYVCPYRVSEDAILRYLETARFAAPARLRVAGR